MTTYCIKRFYEAGPEETEVVETGLSLEEARDHCQSPETSSRTCSTTEGMARTRERGAWFDGYTEE